MAASGPSVLYLLAFGHGLYIVFCMQYCKAISYHISKWHVRPQTSCDHNVKLQIVIVIVANFFAIQ